MYKHGGGSLLHLRFFMRVLLFFLKYGRWKFVLSVGVIGDGRRGSQFGGRTKNTN